MNNIFEFRKSTITLGDRLRALAEEADKNPAQFGKAIVLHAPLEMCFRWSWFGQMTLADFLGLLEIAKMEIFKESRE
jgi:hypothetical protein